VIYGPVALVSILSITSLFVKWIINFLCDLRSFNKEVC